MALLPVHVVQKLATTSKSCNNSECCVSLKMTIQHILFPILTDTEKKKILAIIITQNLSYPEPHKIVESRIISVRVFYSSLFRQQSNCVRHLITQTDFSIPYSIRTKQTRNVCYATKEYASPKLEYWLPSTEPITIEYQTNQLQKSSIQSKKSSELQTQTKAVISPKTSQKLDAFQKQNMVQKSCAQRDRKGKSQLQALHSRKLWNHVSVNV